MHTHNTQEEKLQIPQLNMVVRALRAVEEGSRHQDKTGKTHCTRPLGKDCKRVPAEKREI